MTREEELFARCVAQQQQITALHSTLSMVQKAYGAKMSAEALADTNAALNACEPSSRAKFEAAVAEAIEPRVAGVRKELEDAHAAQLADKDDQIAKLSKRGRL